MLTVKVTDPGFDAKGDGVTNDRASIQKAIDYVHSNGGGTVILTEFLHFVSTPIVLRSNVTLLFGSGAILHQSSELDGYYKPVNGGYEPYTPIIGHNYSETIKWSHTWYKNYPFIFAPEGSENIAIKGEGIIRMADCDNADKLVRVCPIGFYRVKGFEISDITINNYHGYAMMPFTSEHGLISNVKIFEWSYGNGDGICLMNCRNIRVTGCKMYTGDDSVYIFSSYRDPRHSEWWSSDEPQASENIEIDHNDLKSNHCKAFGMILWGIDCPDLEKVEVRNVYVHDNHFETMGNWNYNPYTQKSAPHPVTGFIFENNTIDGIEANFFETPVSDMTCFRSMREFLNADFADGRVFWCFRKNESENSAGVERGENPHGYITELEKGDAAIYQGLYIEGGKPCGLKARVYTTGCKCRLFIREQISGKLIASREFDNTEPEDVLFYFTVGEGGNYHVGLERGDAREGSAFIENAVLIGNHHGAFGYNGVKYDRGKIIYTYDNGQKED